VGTTVIMKNGGVSWIASGIRMAISEPKLLLDCIISHCILG
jgi:hypothetical protein